MSVTAKDELAKRVAERVRNTAVVEAADAPSKKATAAVRVKSAGLGREGGVTG